MNLEKIAADEVRYLYVKEFQYTDSVESERQEGHPREGRVYKSTYNEHTKNWRIILPIAKTVLVVDKLIAVTTDELSEWSCTIEEISKDNILKLNIKEEDLDAILKWDEEVKPIEEKEVLTEQNIVEHVQNALQTVTTKIDIDDAHKMNYARVVLQELLMVNTPLFEVVIGTVIDLLKYQADQTNSWDLTLALGTEGRAVNVSDASRALAAYMKPVKQGGDDKEYVVDAIISLFTELERRSLNNLDDGE